MLLRRTAEAVQPVEVVEHAMHDVGGMPRVRPHCRGPAGPLQDFGGVPRPGERRHQPPSGCGRLLIVRVDTRALERDMPVDNQLPLLDAEDTAGTPRKKR